MRYRLFALLLTTFVLFSCKKDEQIISQQPPTPPPTVTPGTTTLLKEIVIPNLPSPYYHFEYNSDGEVVFASFASDFTRYNVSYLNNRITDMINNTAGNNDVLKYFYNANLTVSDVWYFNPAEVYEKIHYTYDAQNFLVKIEREKKLGSVMIVDKVLSMTYYADGNLKDLNYHYLPFNGQPDAQYTDHFEQYDDKINVDGFGLLKNEFFDHLVLLPGIQLQKNNPAKETRTGTQSDYTVNYTYTYNEKNVPVRKLGDLLMTSGATTGQRFQTHSEFSYY